MKKLIARGAEALLVRKGATVMKQRIPKSYRLLQLDEKLRKQRTKRETRLLQKASALIPVPRVLAIDESQATLELEYIPGKKLATVLDSLPISHARALCHTLGKCLAALHDAGIIHGDLTTSNMILGTDKKLYLIDFGLGFESKRIEDRAVDLHLIKEALEAKHCAKAHEYYAAVLKGYARSKKAKETLARLATVEKRGRYKRSY